MKAYKFVKHDVPALETLKGTKVYSIMETLENGGELTREQKNWVTENCATNTYSKKGICLMGWFFDFSSYMTEYVVENEYGWSHYWAMDKTSIRAIDKCYRIVKIPKK